MSKCLEYTAEEQAEVEARIQALYALPHEEKIKRCAEPSPRWAAVTGESRERTCLRCSQMFMSFSRGHRICQPCRTER